MIHFNNPSLGDVMSSKKVEGPQPKVCPACGRMFYPYDHGAHRGTAKVYCTDPVCEEKRERQKRQQQYERSKERARERAREREREREREAAGEQ